MVGPLALVGGDELNPGNEAQDALLAAAAGDGPAYVVATAAARHRPELAVAHAREWFARFDLDVVELPVRNRTQARSRETAELAARGRFFYLVGGDPGHRSGCVARLAGLAGDRLGVAIGCGARRIVRRRHGHGAVDADPRAGTREIAGAAIATRSDWCRGSPSSRISRRSAVSG